MKFIDINQNTDEWLDLRIGKITGSTCSKMMANFGKAFGDPAKKAAVTIAREQVTGKRSLAESYSNGDMKRGHEQEPLAIADYEFENFVDVLRGGFFDCGNYGCSPDGRIGENGIIEVKSVLDHVHYANIKRNNVDPAYKWQHYFNLQKTEREWIDFVSYCADYPKERRLFQFRIYAEDCIEKFKMIDDRSEQFFELVEEIKTTMV